MASSDRFKRRAFRRGYKVDEVDEFLDRAEATLAGEPIGDPVSAADVRDVVFRTRWGGYDEWQVDLHLDRLERELLEMVETTLVSDRYTGPPALPPVPERLQLPAAPSPATAAVPQPAVPAMPQPAVPAIPIPATTATAALPMVGAPAPPIAPPVSAPPPPVSAPPPISTPPAPPPLSLPPIPAPASVTASIPSVGAAAPRGATPPGYTDPEPAALAASASAPSVVPPGVVPPPDPFVDSFADLSAVSGHDDYDDPFAGHTPKQSVRESFTGGPYVDAQATELQDPVANPYVESVNAPYAEAAGYGEPAAAVYREPAATAAGGVYSSSAAAGAAQRSADARQVDARQSMMDTHFPAAPSLPGAAVPPASLGGAVPVAVPEAAERRATQANANVDPYAGRHGKAEMTMEMPAYGNVSPFTDGDKARLVELRTGFKTRRFGTGYDPQQVERFCDALAAVMNGQAGVAVTAADFDSRQFALLQGGYFEHEVDTTLAEIRELFKRRLG